MIELDSDTHTYTLDGVVVPSVTQVLAPLYDFSRVDADLLQRAADFGTAVHKACELSDADDLDEESLDPNLKPFVDAWRLFVKQSRFQIYKSEALVYSRDYGYAGRLDRIGHIDGRVTIVDIKSSTELHPATGAQLAAYEQSARDIGLITSKRCDRYAVQLRGDGTYRMQHYNSDRDIRLFFACLTIHKWRTENAN